MNSAQLNRSDNDDIDKPQHLLPYLLPTRSLDRQQQLSTRVGQCIERQAGGIYCVKLFYVHQHMIRTQYTEIHVERRRGQLPVFRSSVTVTADSEFSHNGFFAGTQTLRSEWALPFRSRLSCWFSDLNLLKQNFAVPRN